ncbi:hypothetical protein ACA910_000461 [Epithemia clementina (nom. ined.)]
MGKQPSSSSSSSNSPETASLAFDKPLPKKALPEKFQYTTGVCALSYWEPIRLLGEGSISDLHLVVRRDEPIQVRYKEKRDVMTTVKKKNSNNEERNSDIDGKEVYVLKSIMKDHVGEDYVLEEMRREIYNLSHLRHPHIVKIIEAYERRRHIYIIMEYGSGGDLKGHIFPEPMCAVIVAKVLSALAYMHSCGVVHRDIKLENIVFAADGEPKIIDFGLSTKYLSQEYKNMTDKVGTLYSMAPQVLQGVYDEKCDLWSLGVVTYILLSGYKPFWGPPRAMTWQERRKVMIDRIMRCQYMKMQGPSWSKVSKLAKDFCASLLKLDPKDRPTAQQTLDESPWIQKYAKHVAKDIEAAIGADAASATTRQASTTSLVDVHVQQERDRRLALREEILDILVTGLTDKELVLLRNHVETSDTEGTGRISLPELRKAVLLLGVDPPFTSTNARRGWSKWVASKRQAPSNKPSSSSSSSSPQPQTVLKIQKIVDKMDQLCEKYKQPQPGVNGSDNKRANGGQQQQHDLVNDYHDFFARAIEGKGRLVTDAIAKACDDLDVNGTRKVPWEKLQTVLDQQFPEISAPWANKVAIDSDGMVSTIQVLELAGVEVAKHTRDSIRSGLGQTDDADNHESKDSKSGGDADNHSSDVTLMDATNVAIPGGRLYDEDSKELKFVYDVEQKSFRRKN